MEKAILRAALTLFFLLPFVLTPQGEGAEVQRELEGIKRKIEKERQGIVKVKKKEGSIL